ncbi:aldo/keto reductase [Roseomonas marmotae]|uniref:Aldo/keto reductase n=1 Tax=Roseomonas marmotae TaxID=2768161 RepID=A0ABS3K8E3_9PROT|nr:aldo/keto reductase [Roseomonas marmotae]MBO1073739.1 aldo/keto reductase [Roseomonas marmotae]QTI78629.1 aldo/keto reductase [Roseomonas marmotae]
MEQRALGKTGFSVAPLCFGGNVFGWTVDEAQSFKLLDAFVAGGGNFIDTADVYSQWKPGNQGGESETIIGNWLAARGGRDKVVIATKTGAELTNGGKGLNRQRVLRQVEASLKRLRTDHIDLYYSHRDDTETPMEEVLETYDSLIRAGKVRAIGASNFTAARLEEALTTADTTGMPRYSVLQPLYNLYDREFEGALQDLCVTEGVAVAPYYTLAAGFLTGKYRSEADLSKSPRGAKIGATYLNPRGLKLLAAMDQVAARLNVKPSQVAVAWLAARPAVVAPIASATSLAQLEELLAAVRLKLDADAMATLDAAGA